MKSVLVFVHCWWWVLITFDELMIVLTILSCVVLHADGGNAAGSGRHAGILTWLLQQTCHSHQTAGGSGRQAQTHGCWATETPGGGLWNEVSSGSLFVILIFSLSVNFFFHTPTATPFFFFPIFFCLFLTLFSRHVFICWKRFSMYYKE